MSCILNPWVGVINKIICALHFVGPLSKPEKKKKKLVAQLILGKAQLVWLESFAFLIGFNWCGCSIAMCCILNPCVGVVNKIIYALHFIGLLSQPPKKQLVAHLILPKTQLVLLEPIVFLAGQNGPPFVFFWLGYFSQGIWCVQGVKSITIFPSKTGVNTPIS